MASPLEALRGVPNASEPIPRLLTGGQPLPHHFEALKGAGLGAVLDIRDPMEPRPFDEPAVVEAAGLEYINVPVTGNLSDEVMEELLGVLRERSDRGLLFHCASGNRVAGPMIAYLILDHGLTEDDAITAGMRMGLRGADILQWGLDYARRHSGG
jgi:protein tyrosine phosphatase (PTP) superfamily phosphohydrolase (DUF442 family)